MFGRITLAAMAVSAAICTAGVAGAIPPPDPTPTGGDPAWHGLAEGCHAGSMQSCDALAKATKDANAPVFFQYAFSCGGRVKYDQTRTNDYTTCLSQYPSNP